MSTRRIEPSLRSTWGDWVGQQWWDLFVTLTPEKQTHPEAMQKRFRYVANKYSVHCYGRNWERRGTGVQWLVGLERFKSGWPHCHGVMRFPGFVLASPEGRDIFDLGYWSKWTTETGGFAWLSLARSQQAVVNYVSKYVVKDGELHWSSNCEFPAPPPQIELLHP